MFKTADKFAASLGMSELSKRLRGEVGQTVDVNQAMVSSEMFEDIQATVNISAAKLTKLGQRFLSCVANTLDDCLESDVWLLGSIIDGGPAACFLKLRIRGDEKVTKSNFALDLSKEGRLGSEFKDLQMTILDTVDVVFTMIWSATEIKNKILGIKGIVHILSTRLQIDEKLIKVDATELRHNLAQISVSLVGSFGDKDEIVKQIIAHFPAVCTQVGLATPKEVPFHDTTISLSNIVEDRFATEAQENFKQVLLKLLFDIDEHLVTNLQIIQTQWPSSARTLVQVRCFGDSENDSENHADAHAWKLQLVKAMREIVINGDFASELRRIGFDVEVDNVDHLECIFSLKGSFVRSMKGSGLWQSFLAEFSGECALFLSDYDPDGRKVGDSHDEDEMSDHADSCEVIAGTMNEQQFVECLKSINVRNSLFARRLFQVFDEDKSGTIESEEFIHNFERIHEGSSDEKADILYKIHNIRNTQGITEKSMRLFVRSFFHGAEIACRGLATQLDSILSAVPLSELAMTLSGDRFVTIKRVVVRKTCDEEAEDYDYSDTSNRDKIDDLDVGSRVVVLESKLVGGHVRIRVGENRWTSHTARNGEKLLAPRMETADLGMALQKNIANEIDWHVNALVQHAMENAKLEPGRLQQREFNEWVQNYTTLTIYLESILMPWMAPFSEEEAHMHAAETREPESESEAAMELCTKPGLVDKLHIRAESARNSLNRIIRESDIGKTVEDVLHQDTNDLNQPPCEATTEERSHQSGIRWARAFTIIHRSEAVTRSVMFNANAPILSSFYVCQTL